MQFIMQRLTRQLIAFQFTHHFPVLTIFRSFASNGKTFGSQLVVIGHHTNHANPSGFNLHGTTVVVLQPSLFAHQDILRIGTTIDSPFGLLTRQHTILRRNLQHHRFSGITDTISYEMCRQVIVDSRRSPSRTVACHIS